MPSVDLTDELSEAQERRDSRVPKLAGRKGEPWWTPQMYRGRVLYGAVQCDMSTQQPARRGAVQANKGSKWPARAFSA